MQRLFIALTILFHSLSPVEAQFQDAVKVATFEDIEDLPAGSLRIFVGDLGLNYIYLYEDEAIEVRFDKKKRHDEPFEIRYLDRDKVAATTSALGKHWYLLGYDNFLLKDIEIKGNKILEDFVRDNFDRAKNSASEWSPIVQINPDDLINFNGNSYRLSLKPNSKSGQIAFQLWLFTLCSSLSFISAASPAIGLKFFVAYLKAINAPLSWRDGLLGIAVGQLSVLGVAGWIHYKAQKQNKPPQLPLGRGSDILKYSRYMFGYSSLLFGGTALYIGCATVLRSLGIPIP